MVKKGWAKGGASPDAATLISPADKELVRQNILPALVHAPPSIRVQLAGALACAVEDYPAQWPGYLPAVVSFISSGVDHHQVMAGLIGLHELVKIFRWKVQETHSPMVIVVKAAFSQLLDIAEMLVQGGAPDASGVDAALMLKTIMKIYYVAAQYELAKPLRAEEALARWCTVFVNLVGFSIPASALNGLDAEDIGKHVWWKAKKWAFQCLNKLFSRYGNPALETFRDGTYRSFAKSFMEKFAPVILTAYMAEIEKIIVHGAVVPDKIKYCLASFLADSVKHKVTWSLIKPHVDTIVSKFIFPALCITDADLELWEDDIVEFVQKKVDPMEDFHTAHSATTNLLITLVTDRPKTTFIPVLQFINSVFSSLPSCQRLAGPREKARAKDGAMAMLIAVSRLLVEKEGVREQVGDVVINFIIPELASDVPFIRVRACQVVGALCREDAETNIIFGDPSQPQKFPGGWNIAAEKVLHLLNRAEDLPVRVYAALALEHLSERPELRDSFAQHVQFVMQELLNLTNTIDMDVLTDVMERYVELFPNELAPVSIQLCEQLAGSFVRILSESQNQAQSGTENDDEWDENGDKIMAAMGIIKTMNTLLYSIDTDAGKSKDASSLAHNIQLVEKLEAVIVHCARFVLQHEIVDLYDEIFEIMDSCMDQLKRVTTTMWDLFELLCNTIQNSAIDFIEEALPVLDNYFSYGADVVRSNEKVRAMIFDIIRQVLYSDTLDDCDRVMGFRLIQSVLLNCRGFADELLEPFAKIALEKLDASKSASYFVHCLEVLLNCIYYNPVMTMQFLSNSSSLDTFFNVWASSSNRMSRVHDKKLGISATLAVLRCVSSGAAQQRGVELTEDHIRAIMKCSVAYFESLPRAMEEREELLRMYNMDDDDSDDSDDEASSKAENTTDTVRSGATGGNDEDDATDEESYGDDVEFEDDFEDSGDIPDDEAAYMEMLARQAHDAGGVVDDDEDWSNELSEELYYGTPLDKVDVYVQFVQAMEEIQHVNAQLYALCLGGLTEPELNVLQTVSKVASEHQAQPSL